MTKTLYQQDHLLDCVAENALERYWSGYWHIGRWFFAIFRLHESYVDIHYLWSRNTVYVPFGNCATSFKVFILMEIAGLYTEFYRSLLTYVRSKIRSKEDAEDILQNVFVKISANAASLSEKEKIQNWLFTITRNAVIDYYRVNAKKKSVDLDESISEQLFVEERTDPTKGLDTCVSTMIALLPEEYSSIVEDAEIHGIPQKALAEKYNMAYSSMRSRVQRGRERLKQLFYNCCHIQADKRGNVIQVKGRPDCEAPCQPKVV